MIRVGEDGRLYGAHRCIRCGIEVSRKYSACHDCREVDRDLVRGWQKELAAAGKGLRKR